MAKTDRKAAQQEAKAGKKRMRLPKGVRKHIRQLKAEGREEEALALRRTSLQK